MEKTGVLTFGACGHTAQITIKGADENAIREKAENLKIGGMCPNCYWAQKNREKSQTHHAVRMWYSKYKKLKEENPMLEAVHGSYDPQKREIMVWILNDGNVPGQQHF